MLNRYPDNYFAETEQVAFGTGVLVDGLDFSDDKLLVGRTFSYSDTQRYRVGTNYLQLPINQPKNVNVFTGQRDGQMALRVDVAPGQNPHINYEPSLMNGLVEAVPAGKAYEPEYSGKLVREKIDRTNDFQQAGDTWRNDFNEFYRSELVNNLSGNLAQCTAEVAEKVIGYVTEADAEYGRRVREAVQQKRNNNLGVDMDAAVEYATTASHSGKEY